VGERLGFGRMSNAPPEIAILRAIAEANKSPCAKSKRGVVAYRPYPHPHIVASGHNAQPSGFACDGSDACKSACAMLCIHAEQAVLAQEFDGPRFSDRAYLVHVKTVDGLLVPSGGPSCWQCSRLMFDPRIRGIWLFHESGWCLYGPVEFHEQTLSACGLPVICSMPPGSGRE
jgi:hypothetical protein